MAVKCGTSFTKVQIFFEITGHRGVIEVKEIGFEMREYCDLCKLIANFVK